MHILVISDIHANLTALEAVLAAAGRADAIWCLGDVVGYGPDPNECIDLLRNLAGLTCLTGNHDSAALGRLDLASFNREARASARWTQSVLTSQNRDFLTQQPERVEIHGITLAHGSPRSPVWEYLLDYYTALENFSYFQTQICLVGHTHLPAAFCLQNEGIKGQVLRDQEIPEINGRMIINPGSVGQPRDHDPRAAYALLNLETQEWVSHRVDYDISSVQARMQQANLPSRLVLRLAEGW